jgi:hypothetical protein
MLVISPPLAFLGFRGSKKGQSAGAQALTTTYTVLLTCSWPLQGLACWEPLLDVLAVLC